MKATHIFFIGIVGLLVACAGCVGQGTATTVPASNPNSPAAQAALRSAKEMQKRNGPPIQLRKPVTQ